MSMTGYLLRYLSSKYFILGTKIYNLTSLYLCHIKSNAKASANTIFRDRVLGVSIEVPIYY